MAAFPAIIRPSRPWCFTRGLPWCRRHSWAPGCAARSIRISRFLLGWAIGPLVLLECFRTKLIHYYLPAIPACALSDGLAGLVGHRRGREHQAQAARPPGDGAAGRNRAGWHRRPGRGNHRGAGIAPTAHAPRRRDHGGRNTRRRVGLSAGATERAVYSLAASWALIMITVTGWLIPGGEPYRTSRVLGEKLAALAAELNVEPVLLEYQEPGVVYAVGHPIALTRDRDGFFAHLKGGRSVLTVALPSEIEVMRNHFGLVVKPVDEVNGFILTKGQQKTLQIAVVHEGDEPPVPPVLDPNARRIGLKFRTRCGFPLGRNLSAIQARVRVLIDATTSEMDRRSHRCCVTDYACASRVPAGKSSCFRNSICTPHDSCTGTSPRVPRPFLPSFVNNGGQKK